MNELYTTEQSYHRLLTLIQTVSVILFICVAALAGAWGINVTYHPLFSSICHIDHTYALSKHTHIIIMSTVY